MENDQIKIDQNTVVNFSISAEECAIILYALDERPRKEVQAIYQKVIDSMKLSAQANQQTTNPLSSNKDQD